MQDDALIPHLFRTEYRKIVSVLCKHFGFDQIEIAEDITSETFLTATQTWRLKGVPLNPVAWLYTVAKNKAKNQLQRSVTFDTKIAPELKLNALSPHETEIDLSPQNINDSQLQMIFAICNPAIPTEAQIGLSLRILCGFGIEEIADAFLTNKETINKRLLRAREKIREEKIPIELPPPGEIDKRLKAVLTTIYLLFNEGYYSVSQNKTIRRDLCHEAMRLCTMLVENEATCKPSVNALLSLMCFHASRLDARLNENGELVLYDEQDDSLWNTDLVSKGEYFLKRAAGGDNVSRYHIEAGIAWWHTQKKETYEKWENILHLYDQLLVAAYSPIAALNRTFALSKVKGKPEAIHDAEKLNLTSNHFYFALLGELYSGIDNAKALENLRKAMALARTVADNNSLQKKIDNLEKLF